MKRISNGVIVLISLLALIICFHTYRSVESASVTGRILPGNEIHSVVAVQGKDSIRILSPDGSFGLDLPPGKWKLVIPVHEKTPAYMERTLEISKGEHIDLGQIRMLP